MANSVDPDETPRSAASHLGLHCLLMSVCQNTYDKYGIFFKTVMSVCAILRESDTINRLSVIFNKETTFVSFYLIPISDHLMEC